LAREFTAIDPNDRGRLYHLWQMAQQAAQLITWPVLVTAAAGAVLGLLGRARGMVAAVVLFGLFDVASGLAFQRKLVGLPDVEGYLLPALAAATVLGAVAIEALVAGVPRVGAYGAALLAGAMLWYMGPPTWRSQHRFAQEVALALLDELPPRSAAILASDHILFPTWYLQRIEGARPDTVVFAQGLATSSWYLRRLKQAHPWRYIPYVDDHGVVPAPGGAAGIANAFARGSHAAGEWPLVAHIVGDICRVFAATPRAADVYDRAIHAYFHLQSGDWARSLGRYDTAIAQYFQTAAAYDGADEQPPSVPPPPPDAPAPATLPPPLQPGESVVLVNRSLPLVRAAEVWQHVYHSPIARALAEEAVRRGGEEARELLR
jgi:hypothetical protein